MKEGRLKEIIDYTITDKILPKCLKEFAKVADRCLHSNPKQRPTMAEVVACLESVLALQEKANHALQPSGLRIFGNKVPMLPSWSIGDKSVRSKRSLELYFDSIGGENRILRRFEFATINVATQNFSQNNEIEIIGWKYFSMYKGTLQNGKGVSIARYYSVYGSHAFINEVELLVKLEHENLLKLVGYCIEGTHVFLVYKFALWKSLDHILYGRDPECTLLDWNKRHKILLGVAVALLYLHQHAPMRIIHGHVAPSNILLDDSFDPKLSHLGFARCLATNEADCIEVDPVYWTKHICDRRYMAPEYKVKHHLSTKADVYGFGVLILVTISGCEPYFYGRDGMDLIQRVWTNWLEGTCSYIIDPRIDADSSTITRFIHIGLLCVQKDPADRPTMEEVVGMLTNTLSLALPVPKILMSWWMMEMYSDASES